MKEVPKPNEFHNQQWNEAKKQRELDNLQHFTGWKGSNWFEHGVVRQKQEVVVFKAKS